MFGGTDYDDQLVRLKLKQAFGRLIRRADDRGVFVLLDRQMPSRLLGAFPPGVEVRRIGLAEAIAETKAFLEPISRPSARKHNLYRSSSVPRREGDAGRRLARPPQPQSPPPTATSEAAVQQSHMSPTSPRSHTI